MTMRFLLALLALPLMAQPKLFFSDLDWGPKTGWEGSSTKGAAVTIWGLGFGTTRGTNYVTVNGVQLTDSADYAEWGTVSTTRSLERTTFWLKSTCTDGAGTISVTVNGNTSATIPFTVAAGAIYFISTSGNNASAGTTVATAWKDIAKFNPAYNPSGDGQYIVYVKAGTYTTFDVDSAFVALRGPYGSATKRKALVGYPGEVPSLTVTAVSRGVIWNANYAPYGRNDYMTFAKLRVTGGTMAFGLWGDYLRVVGNSMEDMLSDAWTGIVMVDNSQQVSIYGNLFKNCGYDSYKHNVYIKTHPDYIVGDKSIDYVTLGWNEFDSPTAGADNRGGAVFVSRGAGGTKTVDHVYIHSNYFHGGNMEFIYTGDTTPHDGDIWIYNNVLRENTNGFGGMYFAWGTRYVYLYNNTFYGLTGSGIMMGITGTAQVVSRNNIYRSLGSVNVNIETYQGATYNSQKDLFYGATTPSGAGITVTDASTANPLLVSVSDYHLQTGSPALGAGTTVSPVVTDYDGLTRPSAPALGAYDEAAAESAPALTGLSNGVLIADASGAAQTSAPRTIYRTFAQGEFASGTYPKPRIDSSVPSVWQVDVATTWPDGSVMAAYLSFRLSLTANGSAVVDFVTSATPCHLGNLATCQAAALTQQGMLDYDTGSGTGSWSATWYGTVELNVQGALARTMINAGAWRWMLRGPVVSAIIVEDRSPALAYDFGWTYNGLAWVAPTSDNYKSLHPVFEIRFYPDPDGAGTLTAWGGVEVDAQLWNASTTRLQMFNSIALVLKTGNAEATTSYSVSGKSFHARSRRHYRTWSGTAPGAVVVDYNFRYLIHTKLLPPYDPDFAVTSASADAWLNEYAAELGSDEPQWCTDSSHCGNWRKGIGVTGARSEIALVARFYLFYLYFMGNSEITTAKKAQLWNTFILGDGDAGGSLPAHYFETATGKIFFSEYDTTDAFGRFGSINARPGWEAGTSVESTAGLTAERVTPVCTSAPCDGRDNQSGYPTTTNGWQAYGTANYTSHAPSIYSIPAFLTGYHYYITGAQMEAAYALATNRACANGSDCRQYQHGLVWLNNPLRGTAWSYRNIMWAALLSSDAIERAYFVDKLKKNARYGEGILWISNGAYPPANSACPGTYRTDGTARAVDYDIWCAGRYYWSNGGPGLLTSNPLFHPDYGSTTTSTTDGWVTGARRTTRYWTGYLGSVIGWIVSSEAFLDADSQPVFWHVRNGLASHFAGRVLYSPTSMNLLRDIEGPVGADGTVATDWANHVGAYATTYTLGADMTTGQSTIVINSVEIRSPYYYWYDLSWWKVGNEYMRSSGLFTANSPSTGKTTITVVKRGDWGSAAAAHTSGDTVTWIPGPWGTYSSNSDGYPIVARGAIAMLADAVQIGDYAPRLAYNVFSASLPVTTPPDPYWLFVPRESVQSVVATGGTGTASLSWLAPSGAQCIVYLGATAPTSSQDGTSETVNTSRGRRQSYSGTGLTAGTKYYRITCGTARVSGTVTVN